MRINVAIFAKYVNSRNPNLRETKDGIIYTIYTNLDSHVANLNTWHKIHLAVSDRNKEGIDTLVLAADECLTEHDCLVCMVEAVRYPVLLAEISWAVDNKFLSFLIISHCCLHLHSIISVAELSEAEASD